MQVVNSQIYKQQWSGSCKLESTSDLYWSWLWSFFLTLLEEVVSLCQGGRGSHCLANRHQSIRGAAEKIQIGVKQGSSLAAIRRAPIAYSLILLTSVDVKEETLPTTNKQKECSNSWIFTHPPKTPSSSLEEVMQSVSKSFWKSTWSSVGSGGCQGYDDIWDLELLDKNVSSGIVSRFPHLSGCSSLKLPQSLNLQVGHLHRKQRQSL